MAVDPEGVLYAATSPNGEVYRIEKGKAAEFFAPNVTYIWSLAFAKDGALYVGTGDQGRDLSGGRRRQERDSTTRPASPT